MKNNHGKNVFETMNDYMSCRASTEKTKQFFLRQGFNPDELGRLISQEGLDQWKKSKLKEIREFFNTSPKKPTFLNWLTFHFAAKEIFNFFFKRLKVNSARTIVQWNQETRADGDLFNVEFMNLYDEINSIREKEEEKIGKIEAFYLSEENIPTDYLPLTGLTAYNQTDYSILVEKIKDLPGWVLDNEAGTFTTPNLRGYFLKQRELGEEIGQFNSDSVGPHTHDTEPHSHEVPTQLNPPGGEDNLVQIATGTASILATQPATVVVKNTGENIGTKTVPQHIPILYAIKAR